MKKLHLFAVLAAVSASAGAQSSVTLFGVVDATVGTIHNGAAGSSKYVGASGNETSRLGLRGSEDLGGGLRAGFWLEGEVFNDTGNGNSAFNWKRRSTVSLSSASYGEVRLGRDVVPTYSTRSDFDPFGNYGIGSQANVLALNQPIQVGNQSTAFAGAVDASPLGSGSPTFTRASNAIGYFTPDLGGFYGRLMVAAGERTPGVGNYVGGRVGYQAGPWHVAGSYGHQQLDTIASNGTKEYDLGASYDFGIVKLMGQYDKITSDRSVGTSDLKDLMVGAMVPLGRGVLKGSYSRAKISGAATGVTGLGEGTARMLAVGYVYEMSKRTALYTTAAQIKNDDGMQFTVGAHGDGPSMLLNGSFLTGQTSRGFEIGIRHRF